MVFALLLLALSCTRPRGVYIDLLRERWAVQPLATRAVIDLAGSAQSAALLSGWGERELDEQTGMMYRWATARSVAAAFWLSSGDGCRLSFRARPLSWSGAPPQVIALTVNGKPVGEVTLHDGTTTCSLPLADDVLLPGKNIVTFSFSRLDVPQQRIAGTDDTRSLAAAFYWIELSPRPYGPSDVRPVGEVRSETQAGPALSLAPNQGLAFEARIPRIAPKLSIAATSFGESPIDLDVWVKSDGPKRKYRLSARRAGASLHHDIDLSFVAGTRTEIVLVPHLENTPAHPGSTKSQQEFILTNYVLDKIEPEFLSSHVVFDFDPGEDDGSLGAGWAPPERSENSAETFAWAVGRRAEVELWLVPEKAQWLSFRAWPFTWEGASPQDVRVSINDAPLGRVILPADASTFSLAIPADTVRYGKNRIVFEFARATAPRDCIVGSKDRRPLAAALAWLEISSAPSAPNAQRPRLGASGSATFSEYGYVLRPGMAAVLPVRAFEGSARLICDLVPLGEGSGRVSIHARHADREHGVSLKDCGSSSQGTRCEALLPNLARAGGEVVIHVHDDGRRAKESSMLVALPRLVGSSALAQFATLNEVKILGRPEFRSSRPNLILIVADTLRADHVGAYSGYVRTPFIDALAERGMLFRGAYSPCPITGPSHAAMFTSSHPRHLGVLNNAQRLSDSFSTLAEVLHDKGYSTAAFVSLGVLSQKFGFGQGFQTYNATFGADWLKNAEEVNQAAFDWVRNLDEGPFFLWLHYSDPHEPYAPPDLAYPELEVRLGATLLGTIRADGRTHTFATVLTPGHHSLDVRLISPGLPNRLVLYQSFSGTPGVSVMKSLACTTEGSKTLLPPLSRTTFVPLLAVANEDSSSRVVEIALAVTEDLSTSEIRARYAREVEYMDRHIGRMLGLLEARGMLSNSYLVFVADHGECLGEHEHVGHISRLYEPALRVPFIIVKPGMGAAKRIIDVPVSLLDLMPTTLELLGIPAPPDLAGTSLISTSPEDLAHRPIWAETFPPESPWRRQAVVAGDWKLIRTLDGSDEVFELYHLREDPAELDNLAASRPDKLRELTEALNKLRPEAGNALRPSPNSPHLSKEERARLRSLGYLH